MSDLRGSITGVPIERIAEYFGASVKRIRQALDRGANTWQDIYDDLQSERV